uniref:Secreted protein n=1 Tax=Globodera pallida TaxID=36090 RepID=A0A183C7Y0_GLOPA
MNLQWLAHAVLSALAAINELTHTETKENERLRDIDKNKLENEKKALADLKMAFDTYEKLWDIVQELGLDMATILLWVYKHAIHDPMLAKHPLELKKVQDPCEEAKLKVKKTEGSSSSG